MFKHFLRILLALIATIPVSFPATAKTFQVKAENQSASGKRSFIWRVKSPKATAYLLGSVHVAKSGIYPLNDKIEEAFADSDTLVVEVNIEEASLAALAMDMMAKAAYPKDDSLEKHVSSEVLALAVARLEKYGLPVEQFKRFKPWFVAMTIELAELKGLDITPENGIDRHFLTGARGKKKILELESAKDQLNLLDSFSEKEQQAFLTYTLKELENTGKRMDDIMAAWADGDENKLDALIMKVSSEDRDLLPVYKKLIDDRNRKMSSRIEEYLNTEHTYFIVVGAGHLVGENGLVQILGRKYEVKQF